MDNRGTDAVETSTWFRIKRKDAQEEPQQPEESKEPKGKGKKRQEARADASQASPAPDSAAPRAGEGEKAPQQDDLLAEEPSDEYQAEDRPRVLAYSDSDSDVETHFKRVKQHLLPPLDDERTEQAIVEVAAVESAAAAAAAEVQETALAAAALQSQKEQQSKGRLRRTMGTAFASVAHHIVPHLTAGFAARLCTLVFLRRLNPSLEDAVELLTLAIPITGAAATKLGINTSGLPAPLLAAGREANQLGKAAAVLSVAKLVGRGLQRRRRAGAPGRLRRMKSVVNVASLQEAEAVRPEPANPPETAAEFAAVFAAEMEEMKRMLRENGITLPERFDTTNAELLRYAGTCGLLTAKSVAERAAAVEGGVRRIVHTVEWLSSQRFLTEQKLRRWERLVAWKSADARGHPILLVRVGRALQLVKPERMQDFMDTILSQVNRGMTSELSNESLGGERMVVVLDARGASSLALTRHMSLLKHLAVALNQHYPDRLHRLYLLELPLLLRWAVQVVLPLLHPVTRDKVVLSSMEDPDLPVTVAYLTKRRSLGTTLRRTTSEVTLPGSGGSTPGALSPTQSLPGLMDILPSTSEVPEPAAEGSAPSGMVQRPTLSTVATSRGGDTSPAEGGDASQQAPPSPGTLEAAWDAYMQSCMRPSTAGSAVRRSFDYLAAQRRSSQDSSAAAAAARVRSSHDGVGIAAAAAAAAAAVAGEGPPMFGKSISTPAFLHSASSSFDLMRPRRGYQSQDLPREGVGAVAGGQVLGPGADGGISSYAVHTLSREASDVSSAAAGAEEAASAAAPAGSSASNADGVSAPSPGLQAARAAAAPPPSEPTASPQDGQSEAPCSPPAAAASSHGDAGEGVEGSAAQSGGGTWAAVMGWLGGSQGAPSSVAAGGTSAPPSPAQEGAGGSRPLLGHRVNSFTSSMCSSAGSSPRTPRGGLGTLPERRRRRPPGSGPTPRKPSLWRESSLERTLSNGSSGLGSHPLRRQSSVSWAEELESVKEIAETPELGGGSPRSQDEEDASPPGGGTCAPLAPPTRAPGALAASAASAALMPAMLLFVMVAMLLQQIVLPGLAAAAGAP